MTNSMAPMAKADTARAKGPIGMSASHAQTSSVAAAACAMTSSTSTVAPPPNGANARVTQLLLEDAEKGSLETQTKIYERVAEERQSEDKGPRWIGWISATTLRPDAGMPSVFSVPDVARSQL